MIYNLRDPAKTFTWNTATDLEIDTSAACTIQSEVYQIDNFSEVAPDSVVFTYTQGANEFQINYNEDVQLVGSY